MIFKNSFYFLITILHSIKGFLSGRGAIADFKDIEDRLKICRECEYKLGDALKNMKCKICQCKIRYKVRLTYSSCPDGKWNSTDS